MIYSLKFILHLFNFFVNKKYPLIKGGVIASLLNS
nr:MAG TPA: hypothetical protein [Caudoviricetes sp.]